MPSPSRNSHLSRDRAWRRLIWLAVGTVGLWVVSVVGIDWDKCSEDLRTYRFNEMTTDWMVGLRSLRELVPPYECASFAAMVAFAGDDPPRNESKSEKPLTIPKPWKKGLSKSSAKLTDAEPPDEKFAIPVGQWTELLPMVDPRRHAKGGEWKTRGDTLEVAAAESSGRAMVPVIPRGSYAIKVEFTRKADGLVGVILPVGTRQCLAAVNYQGAANGLDTIQGRPANDNQSTFQAALVNGRRYTLEISVRVEQRDAAVTVNLDDRPLMFYRGPATALALARLWSLGPRNCLGLAVQSDVVFHSVKFRPSSPASLVPPPLEPRARR